MAYEPLAMLPISLLLGFLFFAMMVRSRWHGEWLWLETLGDRLAFFTWPRPPARIIRLRMLNGEDLLLFNASVEERKGGVRIETPLGFLRSPEKASAVYPLTAIYLPGRPNPMSLVVYAMSGLATGWLSYYYGYLLLGLEPNPVFLMLALVYIGYIMLYYQAASTNGVEYHEYEVRGLAPPFLYAVPSSNLTSPLKAAKYWNTPILIRVTDTARHALEELKHALGVENMSEAAELLAAAEFYNVIIKKAVSLKVKAARVQEAFTAFQSIDFAIGRITVGKVLLAFLLVGIGFVMGWAMHGSIVIVPPGQTPPVNMSPGVPQP